MGLAPPAGWPPPGRRGFGLELKAEYLEIAKGNAAAAAAQPAGGEAA